MKRREFIRTALTVTMAPAVLSAQTAAPISTAAKVVSPGPLPWMLGLDHLDANPIPLIEVESVAEDATHLFSDTQMSTLIRLCEILLPSMNGHPGAREALTPEFLDFFVALSASDVKSLYRDGLDNLETSAGNKFRASFSSLTAVQIDVIIRPLLATWMKDHLPRDPERRFLNRAHYDIRVATRNSAAWALAAAANGKPLPEGHLYWLPIEPEVDSPIPSRADSRRNS